MCRFLTPNIANVIVAKLIRSLGGGHAVRSDYWKIFVSGSVKNLNRRSQVSRQNYYRRPKPKHVVGYISVSVETFIYVLAGTVCCLRQSMMPVAAQHHVLAVNQNLHTWETNLAHHLATEMRWVEGVGLV
jgi:hypothetical protein